MLSTVRPILTVLAGATLLGSMGAWGRAVYRFEGDPMVVVAWRAAMAQCCSSSAEVANRVECAMRSLNT